MKKEYRSPLMSLWDFEISNYLQNILNVSKEGEDSDDSDKVKQITIVSMDSDDDW